MNKIKLIITILLLLSITPLAKPAWAANNHADTRLTQAAAHLTTIASKAAERQGTQLAAIQKSADTMIETRITSLNILLSKIQNDTRLSADEKTTLTTDINTMITNLTTLKAKIDADTDVTTARADRKTIVTSYHVYVTFEPQIRLLTIINNLETTTTTVQNLTPQLASLSSTLKSQGKDTAAMDTAIADINTQLTNIKTLLTNDQTKLSSVQLTNNTYASTFVQIRQDLAKVRVDFAQIRHDIAIIKGSLTKTKTTAVLSGTPVPSTSCLPRPACLDAKPRCLIAEPASGWCNPTTPQPTVVK